MGCRIPPSSQKTIWHAEGLCDHVSVGYELNLQSDLESFALPSRAPVVSSPPDQLETAFEVLWDEHTLESALQAIDTDRAWSQLSLAAERTLCPGDHDGRAHSHAEACEPVPEQKSAPRATQHGHESGGIQGLRRLCHRLRELSHSPCNHQLRAKVKASLRGVRARVPDLPYVPPDAEECALDQVQSLLDTYVTQEKDGAIAQWRQRIRDNESRQISWVKCRTELALEIAKAPLPIGQAMSAIHPVWVLKTHGEAWTKVWTSEPRTSEAQSAMSAIIDSIPQRDKSTTTLELSTADLQLCAKKMSHKAPGPDSWSAKELLSLPSKWWSAFTCLWNAILNGAPVPKDWKRGLVALLPKRVTGTRPIGLLQTAWRIGARAICGKLKNWVSSWVTPSAFGAAPGYSTSDAHFRIYSALRRQVRGFVVQDLKGFFDHLQIDTVLPLLARLGAPDGLSQLLTSFHSGAERLFVSQGYTAPQWTSVSRGLVQGDPLSPLLALTVAHFWAAYVLRGRVRGLMYVDDRLLWVEHCPDRALAMRDAIHRSQTFDAAFGLFCEASRCSVVAPADDTTYDSLARSLGYPQRLHLEILGVQIDLDKGQGSLLKLSLDKVKWRLHFLKLLPISVHRKVHLLWTLAYSSMFWCAGIAAPDLTSIKNVKQEALGIFHRGFTFEVPDFLKHVILGWNTDPQFLLEFTALRKAIKLVTHRPAWLEQVSADHGNP